MISGDIIIFNQKWRHVTPGSTGLIIEKLEKPAPPIGVPKTIYKILVLGHVLKVPEIFIEKISMEKT